jgi:hypothetical protein
MGKRRAQRFERQEQHASLAADAQQKIGYSTEETIHDGEETREQ